MDDKQSKVAIENTLEKNIWNLKTIKTMFVYDKDIFNSEKKIEFSNVEDIIDRLFDTEYI